MPKLLARPERRVVAGLALLAAVATAIYLHEGAGLVTFGDEYDVFITRRGLSLDSFLLPHNEHLIALPVAIYKVLLAVAGLKHYWVFRVVEIGIHLTLVLVVFALLRTRLGDRGALLASVPVLFFGAGGENVLYPFQMAFVIPLAAGLGALAAVELDERRGDIAAAVLLVVAVGGSGIALPVLAAVGVWLVLKRSDWRRLWVVVPAAVTYGAWTLGYHPAHGLRPHAFRHLPRTLCDLAIDAMAGVSTLGRLAAGGVCLVLAAAVIRRLAGGEDRRRLVALLAGLGVFWVLIALGRNVTTTAQSRYVYVGGVLLVLVLVEAMPRLRRPPSDLALRAIAVLVAVIAVNGLPAVRTQGQAFADFSSKLRSQFTALEIAQDVAPLDQPFVTGLTAPHTGRQFLLVMHDFGDIALSSTEVRKDPTLAVIADRQLVTLEHAAPTPAAAPARGTCHAAGAATPFSAPGLVVRTGEAPATLLLSRFGAGLDSIPTTTLPPHTAVQITVPADRSAVPWTVHLNSGTVVQICPHPG